MNATVPKSNLALSPKLGKREFEVLRRMIYARSGITLSENKLSLAESRLTRRLRALGMSAFSEYVERLSRATESDPELEEMLNCITTNKTSFFREQHHFDWLRQAVVPEWTERARRGENRRVRIWSAGCSTGEEPYSIAMTLSEAMPVREWDVRILASDLDTQVLSHAERGVYKPEQVAAVPLQLQQRAFERTDDGGRRVVEPLRQLVAFRRINLVEPTWPVRTRFDVIFCRNVIIYFDRPTQRRLIERFLQHLEPGGFLVAGHSESLNWISDLIAPVGQTVYRRAGDRNVKTVSLRPRHRSLPPPLRQPSVRPPPRKQIAIHAGELHASQEPTEIRTILGSCVAACLFDPVAKVGGANHFALPDGDDAELTRARYGVHAMEMLINSLMKLGAQRERLIAKVFGASYVISGSGQPGSVPHRNAEFVLEFLRDEGITLAAQQLEGEHALSIRFETDTGRVLLRKVLGTQEQNAISDERAKLQRMLRAEVDQAVDVTFFGMP